MEFDNLIDIILITYNRKNLLKNTLSQIFDNNSPIKDFHITILDNNSTDGTAELISEYKKKFPNLTHLVNNRNIGGNANIIRAFELVKKKYFWILCDDDTYDWTYWDEVKQAITENRDVILVEHLTKGNRLPIEVIVNELNFLPAGIYKSELLSDDVIHNAYVNIYNSLPHQALICECVNKNKEFFIPEHTIITQNMDKGQFNGYKRGYEDNIHFRIAHYSLFSGMVNSYQMIKDKKIRNKCCGCLYIGKSFYYSMKHFLKTNNLYTYNVCDIFNGVNFNKKIILLYAIFINLIRNIINFPKNDKGIDIQICKKFRTRIIPRWLIPS